MIEDLNVLDYDEYFGMTDTLLAGDIPKAMARLNHICRKALKQTTLLVAWLRTSAIY